ncbi:tRNA-dependent cyclodipeptide synthase [Allokutzneria sp. NRRL B-24872]|uniref:tRNA-dependent cyclodipeptide synthase n=1 Tax=Allokutzneria sp. NRRL B-24872 TaxID=1137961 RepID=UPI001FF01EA2|nr:tRNA-dependent cyclodipeptide synthase [Allokutzneria sp. NRRL B-24872]
MNPGVVSRCSDPIVRPYTERCADLLSTGEHALLGISSFNSYYTDERVDQLLSWAFCEFSRVNVLLPGAEASWIPSMRGADPGRAKKRARQEVARLRRRVQRTLEDLGVDDPDAVTFTWTEVADNAHYDRLLEQAWAGYQDNEEFREACEAISTRVLQTNFGSANPDPWTRESLIGYLFAELPFLVDTPRILGVPNSVFCYHRESPLVELLSRSSFSPRISPDQGHVVVSIESEPIVPAPRAAADDHAREGLSVR